MVTQFLYYIYELFLDGFLRCPHLLGKILNRPLLASHAESLAKQQVLVSGECMIQQAVKLLIQLEPWRTCQVKRVVSVGNPIQTAVVLPSVLHLHQQILFVVQLGYRRATRLCPCSYHLCCLWNITPAGSVTGASEVMLDAVLENISLTFTARLRILLGTQHNGF